MFQKKIFEGIIVKIPKRIFINVKHLEKGDYQSNIVYNNVIVKTINFSV